MKLIHLKAVLPFRETLIGWRVGHSLVWYQGPVSLPDGQNTSLYLIPHCCHYITSNWLMHTWLRSSTKHIKACFSICRIMYFFSTLCACTYPSACYESDFHQEEIFSCTSLSADSQWYISLLRLVLWVETMIGLPMVISKSRTSMLCFLSSLPSQENYPYLERVLSPTTITIFYVNLYQHL